MNLLVTYFVTLGTFLAIDALWLGVIARNFYPKQIGHLMTNNVQWWAAGAFYLIFVGGLVFFVVHPYLAGQITMQRMLVSAAAFGLVTYATYDLTNQATLKDWPVLVTGVDMIWGTVLALGVAFIATRLLA